MKTKYQVGETFTWVMSTGDFCDLPDNPRQRNTAKRAEYARKKHLKKWRPMHRSVKAAVDCDGMPLCKISAHTRARLLQDGHFGDDAPETLEVFCIVCDKREDAAYHYLAEDSRFALEQASDTLYGSMRKNGYIPKSKFLSDPKFGSAFRILCCDNLPDTDKNVAMWRRELEVLDGFDLPLKGKKKLSGPVVAGALMLIADGGYSLDVIREFLDLLRMRAGTKDRGKKDGVEHLLDWIDSKNTTKTGFSGYQNYLNAFLACFILFVKKAKRKELGEIDTEEVATLRCNVKKYD